MCVCVCVCVCTILWRLNPRLLHYNDVVAKENGK